MLFKLTGPRTEVGPILDWLAIDGIGHHKQATPLLYSNLSVINIVKTYVWSNVLSPLVIIGQVSVG